MLTGLRVLLGRLGVVITALAGGRVLAEKTGSTPPAVVALHGWMRSGADFARILAGLDAVAVHLPGFGRVDPPPTAWGTPEYAADIVAVLEETGPAVLLGHSFGGRVAVRVAARRPDLVRGLVLSGVPLLRPGPAPRPPVGYRVIRALARGGIIPRSVLERRRERTGSADYRAARGVMRDVFVTVVNEDYRDDLASITAPTRFVWGALDDQAPADAGRAASELVAGARWREVPDAGHLLGGALEAAVGEELRDLLAEVGPRR